MAKSISIKPEHQPNNALNYRSPCARGAQKLRFLYKWINSMLKVIAHDFIRLEHIQDVMPLYRELVARTKEEPLCVSYDLYIDQKDSGHFVFIEEWPDRAALDAHCNTEHFKRLVPLIDQYQRSPGTYLLMDAFQ